MPSPYYGFLWRENEELMFLSFHPLADKTIKVIRKSVYTRSSHLIQTASSMKKTRLILPGINGPIRTCGANAQWNSLTFHWLEQARTRVCYKNLQNSSRLQFPWPWRNCFPACLPWPWQQRQVSNTHVNTLMITHIPYRFWRKMEVWQRI